MKEKENKNEPTDTLLLVARVNRQRANVST